MIIGLMGGSGNGKSIVCEVAESLGFKIIDADKIGHDIILKNKPAYNEILSFFGRDILLADGEIDRQKLGEIVFSDKQKLEKLNKITHSIITDEIKKRLDGNVIIDGAVLYKTPLFEMCDKIIIVAAPTDKRINFICSRDNISYRSAKKRVESQLSNEEYAIMADVVIKNNRDIESLRSNALKALREVMG